MDNETAAIDSLAIAASLHQSRSDAFMEFSLSHADIGAAKVFLLVKNRRLHKRC